MSDDIDLSTRQLCPDGACIGVIGPDGRCKVCGRQADGPNLAATAAETEAETDSDADTDTVTDLERASDTESAFSDEEDRELCPDGACIGVIGPDGRCKVCGRAAGS
jgi:hypothetical protein